MGRGSDIPCLAVFAGKGASAGLPALARRTLDQSPISLLYALRAATAVSVKSVNTPSMPRR